MKKILSVFYIGIIASFFISWGTFGHEHINRSAVFALPAPLQLFFYNHIDFITQDSTVPDLRKYTLNDKTENPRHFIDLENFGSFDSLPQTLVEAKKKYEDTFLQQNGILPWFMEDLMDKLTKAFKEKKKTEILFIAADLGHYIGDGHMPLHTSANYDGQLTNQKGIHALWESRLPELFGNGYNFHSNDAKFIADIRKEIWRMIFSTHSLKDTLLATDKALRVKFSQEKIFKTDNNGKEIKSKYNSKIYSDDYAKQFHDALNGMVEKQMRASIEFTANFWYTAWVNAGKPDLSDLDPSELTKRNKGVLKVEYKLWKNGKLFGVESEREF